jgi:hypothetical protein
MTEDSAPISPIVIGHESSDHLSVLVLGRTHPGTTDYWDGNWIRCRIVVRADPFHGEFTGDLRTDELAGLREDLALLSADLAGEIAFANMDGHLAFAVTGDGIGHFVVRGEASREPGSGQVLSFRLLLDQTDLPPILADLERALHRYPVQGDPPGAARR